MQQSDPLSTTWLSVCNRWKIADSAAEEMWDSLVVRYSERHRRYHTLSHIGSMVSLLQESASQFEDFDNLLLAAFFHDVVYEPLSSSNESDSADIAEAFLADQHVKRAWIDQVRVLILATASHLDAAADESTAIFLDADLAILGAHWSDYSAYSQAIRMEYSAVPDASYRAGRSAVLKSFLRSSRLFRNSRFFDRFEKQARSNLARELELLESVNGSN